MCTMQIYAHRNFVPFRARLESVQHFLIVTADSSRKVRQEHDNDKTTSLPAVTSNCKISLVHQIFHCTLAAPPPLLSLNLGAKTGEYA